MISKVEKEFRAIATAFERLNGYKYEFLSSFNSAVGKRYPLLLVDKKVVGTRNAKTKQTTYTFNMYYMDTLFNAERANEEGYSTKQDELTEIANQFEEEFIRRLEETNSDWTISNEEAIPSDTFDKRHLDKTINQQRTLEITVFQDCAKGAFRYA